MVQVHEFNENKKRTSWHVKLMLMFVVYFEVYFHDAILNKPVGNIYIFNFYIFNSSDLTAGRIP